MGQVFYDPEPDTSKLPRRRVTPDEFRVAAALARWPTEAVELFLQRPYCNEYVAIGEQGRRMMVRVVDDPLANNPTA